MRFVLSTRWLILCLAAAVFCSACKKSSNGTTDVLVSNATITTGALSVAWSGVSLTPTALAQGGTSGTTAAPYQVLPAGTNNLILKSGGNVLLDKNIYGGPAAHYSMLVYDSNQTSTTPNVLLLTDDLSAVDSVNHAKCRFIDCSPDTLLDVVFVNSTDTIGFGAQRFIGPTPDPSSYQVFGTVRLGKYKPYVFITGTAFNSAPLLSADSVVLASKGIYTFIYSGLRGATGANALKLVTIQHPSN